MKVKFEVTIRCNACGEDYRCASDGTWCGCLTCPKCSAVEGATHDYPCRGPATIKEEATAAGSAG